MPADEMKSWFAGGASLAAEWHTRYLFQSAGRKAFSKSLRIFCPVAGPADERDQIKAEARGVKQSVNSCAEELASFFRR